MTGEELRAWRVTTGYSQEDAAKRFFRVSRATLQNWEAGVTAIPYAVEKSARDVWSRRIRQEQAGHTGGGPVTLVYSDGPFFRSPYGPQPPGSRLFQEQYAMNAHAIARVCELAQGPNFYNYFIVEPDGMTLWNEAELARVINGTDLEAPTRRNLLRRCADAITALAESARQNPGILAFGGQRMPIGEEKRTKMDRVEDLACKLDALAVAAPSGTVTYHQVEEIAAEMRKLGKHPHSSVVSAVAKAFIEFRALDDNKAQQDFEEGFYEEDFAKFEEWGPAEVKRRLTAGEAPFHLHNRERASAEVWLRKKGMCT